MFYHSCRAVVVGNNNTGPLTGESDTNTNRLIKHLPCQSLLDLWDIQRETETERHREWKRDREKRHRDMKIWKEKQLLTVGLNSLPSDSAIAWHTSVILLRIAFSVMVTWVEAPPPSGINARAVPPMSSTSRATPHSQNLSAIYRTKRQSRRGPSHSWPLFIILYQSINSFISLIFNPGLLISPNV